MLLNPINFLATFVTAFFITVVGALWYAPCCCGKQWATIAGSSQEESAAGGKRTWKMHLLRFIVSVLMAYVLAQLVFLLGVSSFLDGAFLGFWLWFGIMLPAYAFVYLLEQKPWKLFAANSGFHLVSCVIAAALLAAWQ